MDLLRFDELPRVRADRVLAPGPVGYDLTAPRLLLHTQQSPAAYARLAATGTLPGPTATEVTDDDDQPVDLVDPFFRPCYDWLVTEHNLRLPPASGCPPGRYPLWAWASIRRSDFNVHIRDAAPRPTRPAGGVWLTLSVPRERVLMADYDTWNVILNRGSLPDYSHRGDSRRRWNSRAYDRSDDALDRSLATRFGPHTQDLSTWSPGLRAAIGDTWQLVFDLPRPGAVQATVATLYDTDVISAVRPQPVPPRARGERRRRGRVWADDFRGVPAQPPPPTSPTSPTSPTRPTRTAGPDRAMSAGTATVPRGGPRSRLVWRPSPRE